MIINKLKFSSKKQADKISQPLLWNKGTKTFSVEISEIEQICDSNYNMSHNNTVIVVDVDTKKELLFIYVSTDKDGSGEDVYGWNYENKKSNCKLLIIND